MISPMVSYLGLFTNHLSHALIMELSYLVRTSVQGFGSDNVCILCSHLHQIEQVSADFVFSV